MGIALHHEIHEHTISFANDVYNTPHSRLAKVPSAMVPPQAAPAWLQPPIAPATRFVLTLMRGSDTQLFNQSVERELEIPGLKPLNQFHAPEQPSGVPHGSPVTKV